jgi:hypothetical protein
VVLFLLDIFPRSVVGFVLSAVPEEPTSSLRTEETGEDVLVKVSFLFFEKYAARACCLRLAFDFPLNLGSSLLTKSLTQAPGPLEIDNGIVDSPYRRKRDLMELTQEIVRELLDYDPLTGVLTWKHRDQKWFAGERHHKMWNNRFAGKPAFTAISVDGYLVGRLFGKGYRSHRVIFLWMTGRWPNPEVDHSNHNRADNRWDNLEETIDNARNTKLHSTNISGRIGVSWYKKSNKWQSQIYYKGKKIFLGFFERFEDAVLARENAERTYGYHQNHGKK